ncbi:ATP-binding protein [Acidihalobacter ferrooxydans]|uniref:histidine kinase n=1 Tax=Acidihalobacter ferrooxydans TaxID=1765967 RepID=A0A1P8UD92_9GAMM|nr:ATP-binding protein [Acidihalobacter ferrooxydans]APZ41729.1 hypothetical protein BW247_00270 [Acidihalobacter ferrooxydans]
MQVVLQRLASRWTQWLAKRPDTEHEQAIWRIVVGGVAGLYFWSPFFAFQAPDRMALDFIRNGILIFISSALVLLIHVALREGPNPARRYIGMTLDLATTSIGMAVGGAGAFPLLAVYLWVIVGNGFRYGRSYLFFATVIALAGYTTASFYNHTWTTNFALFSSTVVVLLVIPFYSSSLIAKLHRAVQQARQASEAKSRFISNMSHELRTPLNGVIGSADLIGQTRLDPEQRELLSLLTGSAHSLLGLIEEVLDISKIEAGHLTIKQAPFDLYQLLHDTARLLTVPAQAKGLRLDLMIDPAIPPRMIGDAQHFRQALTNLLSNSVKFTECGGITLTIDLLEINGEQIRLRCTVADTGIGISETDLPLVFERFRQADEGSTRKFGGTGLGTAITKNLIELMGGQIHVESRVGHGSRFWFELPLQCDQQHKEPPAVALDTVWLMTGPEEAKLLYPLLSEHVPSVKQVSGPIPSHIQGQRIALIADLALISQQAPDTELPVIGLSASGKHTEPYHPPGLMTMLPSIWSPQMLLNALQIVATPYTRMPALHATDADQTMTAGVALNVLVAEDNAVNRRLVERILLNAGHTVTLVEDGESALDLIGEDPQRFEAVILDMHMPKRSGMEVAKALRFTHSDIRTPLIMLSADATTSTIENSRRAGFDAYLTKPIDAARLLKLLQELHNNRPQPNDALAKTRIEQAPPLLNPNVLRNLELLGSDQHFVVRLVQDYVEDARPQLARMRTAYHAQDFSAWRNAAHALRGSSAELGCDRLVMLCGNAERLKNYEIGAPQTHRLLEQIDRAFRLTHAELLQFINGHLIVHPAKK